MEFSDRPTWKQFLIVIVAVLLAVIIGAIVLRGFSHEINTMGTRIDAGGDILNRLEANQANARDRGFATRAQACTTVILDNDRDFELTTACTAPDITAYYPTTICQQFFPAVAVCGTKSDDPAL